MRDLQSTMLLPTQHYPNVPRLVFAWPLHTRVHPGAVLPLLVHVFAKTLHPRLSCPDHLLWVGTIIQDQLESEGRASNPLVEV